MEKNVYEWTGKDRWLYLLSMIFFNIFKSFGLLP